jgi:hypothetical protein
MKPPQRRGRGNGSCAIGVLVKAPWSTDRVPKQTKARVAELALPQMTLPAWYDVDDGAALERLIADLSGDHSSPRSSLAYSAVHTGRLLNSVLLRKGRI